MTTHHLPGTPPVPLTLRRSARARRMTLRVSRLDGRVTLTLPARAREADALAFARAREDWIRANLDRVPEGCPVGIGSTLPVEGTPRLIEAGPGRRVVLEPERLLVPEGPAGPRLAAWLKALARERLAAAADRHAAALGRPYARLTLRDTRSRWGSCTADGALMFSWRLVMAPPRVLDYVAAHEVAHLAELNHSAAFWAHVRALFGPHEAERRWLRSAAGTALHRYDFTAEGGPR